MLAQNFMTAVDLGLTDTEHAALVKVLGALERDEIEHRPLMGAIGRSKGGDLPRFFNMGLVEVEIDCGTACCILGWARHFAGSEPVEYRQQAARRLFLMRELDDRSERALAHAGGHEGVTPAQAASAVRNYLTVGEPEWHIALGQ
jgi:hypothetical protein